MKTLHHKYLPKFIAPVLIFTLFPIAWAQTWDEFNNFLKTTKSFSANFKQNAPDGVSKNQEGLIIFKSPQKLLWQLNQEGTKTARQIILVNTPPAPEKATALIYDLDLRQAIKKNLDINENITPADILLGRITLDKNFILQPPSQNEEADKGWLVAKPKKVDANQNILKIKIKLENGVLVAINMWDSLEREVLINFSAININKTLDEKIFNLVLPESVDVIDETANK